MEVEIDTNILKAALLFYWRYKRQFIAVPEGAIAWWLADILAWRKGIVVEVEIKISIQDLKHDLKKGNKHELYARGNSIEYSPKWPESYAYNPNPLQPRYPPNLFYFCLPEELIEKARPFIEKLNRKYGILSCYQHKYYGPYISVCKSARRLHSHLNDKILDWMGYRLSAALANAYEELYLKDNRRQIS